MLIKSFVSFGATPPLIVLTILRTEGSEFSFGAVDVEFVFMFTPLNPKNGAVIAEA